MLFKIRILVFRLNLKLKISITKIKKNIFEDVSEPFYNYILTNKLCYINFLRQYFYKTKYFTLKNILFKFYVVFQFYI